MSEWERLKAIPSYDYMNSTVAALKAAGDKEIASLRAEVERTERFGLIIRDAMLEIAERCVEERDEAKDEIVHLLTEIERLRELSRDLLDSLPSCSCHEAYMSRDLTDPTCLAHSYEDEAKALRAALKGSNCK